jgi:5-methylcytosine-specific restriction endonuclease McrA
MAGSLSATKPPKRNNTLRIADTTADAVKRKAKRTAARRKAKRSEINRKAADYAKARAEVFARDAGRCRVCGRLVELHGDTWLFSAHTHHIVFRSRGGKHDMANLVLVCSPCHYEIHQREVVLTGTADNLKIERAKP